MLPGEVHRPLRFGLGELFATRPPPRMTMLSLYSLDGGYPHIGGGRLRA